jgi:hypothetical protein
LKDKIKKCKKNVIKLYKKNIKKNNKKNRYYENYDNFISDFTEILESEYITIHKISNIIRILLKYNFFIILESKYSRDKYLELKNTNKKLLDKMDEDGLDVDRLLCNYYDNSEEYACDKITENMINIIKLVYDKFNKINDRILFYILNESIFYKELIINYLEQINVKTKNKEIKNIINEQIHDCFVLVDEINLEDLFSSSYMTYNNYNNIDNIIEKYKLHDKTEQISDILINILISEENYVGDITTKNNIINWLKKNKELTDIQKNKIYGYILLVYFFEASHNNLEGVIITYMENNIEEYNDIIKKFKFTKKISINNVIEVTENLLCTFYKYISEQAIKNIKIYCKKNTISDNNNGIGIDITPFSLKNGTFNSKKNIIAPIRA